MRKKDQRLILALGAGIVLSAATVLAGLGLRASVAYFKTPSELVDVEPGRPYTLGGLVEVGGVREDEGAIRFRLVDDVAGVEVRYAGLLPDLFREGQCVIAKGAMTEAGEFEASLILAKHDETYKPREIDAAPRLAKSCGAPGA